MATGITVGQDELKALTSYDAREAYKAGAKFDDLAKYSATDIQKLTSWDAIQLYNENKSVQDVAKQYGVSQESQGWGQKVSAAGKSNSVSEILRQGPQNGIDHAIQQDHGGPGRG